MDKQGEIRPDLTPPEGEVKTASEDQLENHLTKRTADAAQGKMVSGKPLANRRGSTGGHAAGLSKVDSG